MRHWWLAAALTLAGAGAPLAAHESEPPAPAPSPIEPGTIILVVGSDRLTMQLGEGPLDPDMLLCLEPGEEAIFASERVTFSLTGGSQSAACFTPGFGERKAFKAEEREAAAAAVEQAQAEVDLAVTADDVARATERLNAARQRLWIIDPPPPESAGVEVVESTASSGRPPKRRRTGIPRSAAAPPPPPAVPPRPVTFRIASGSPTVLARFPRGTLVQRGTALCLKAGEQLNVAGSNGQSVSYTGPGCLNRSARPTRENVGGFTFG